MGGGIAQVAAQAGYLVILNDMKEEYVDRGIAIIDENLSKNMNYMEGKSEEEIFSFQSDSNHIILNAKRVRISHKLKDNLKGDFKWLIS